MSLLEEYPKAKRDAVRQLRTLLEVVHGSDPGVREDLARSINGVADKARDLDEIFQRLTQGPLAPNDLADLLIAFQLTIEAIRGEWDSVDGVPYDYGDSLRPPSSEAEEEAARR
jgi:hypothetical protein